MRLTETRLVAILFLMLLIPLCIMSFSVQAQINATGKAHKFKDCGFGVKRHISKDCPDEKRVKFASYDHPDDNNRMIGWTFYPRDKPDGEFAYGSTGYALTGVDPDQGQSSPATNKIAITRIMAKEHNRWDAEAGELQNVVSDMVLDSVEKAPTKGNVASMRIDSIVSAAYWAMYDAQNLGDKGITTPYTDRMSFYYKVDSPRTEVDETAGDNIYSGSFQVATYICRKIESPIGQDGCPYEGVGNNHYYHYVGANPGGWYHAEIDNRPNHTRSVTGNYQDDPPPINPPLVYQGEVGVAPAPDFASHIEGYHPIPSYGMDQYPEPRWEGYYYNLHQFYIQTPQYLPDVHDAPITMWIDEIEFYESRNSVEPNQNEISISSPTIGYFPAVNQWEVMFSDLHRRLDTDAQGTYQLRYSTQPITNNNYEAATIAMPLFMGDAAHVSPTGQGLFREIASGSYSRVWTRFTIPDSIRLNNTVIYFAIKDVSVAGQHTGSTWPYNDPDSSTAPTSNIRIINYQTGN